VYRGITRISRKGAKTQRKKEGRFDRDERHQAIERNRWQKNLGRKMKKRFDHEKDETHEKKDAKKE
jgi:hypothetical protein